MSNAAERRKERNIVSNMYDGWGWKEKVAHMPVEQVTAIYLRYIQNPNRPRPKTPEALEEEELKSKPQSYQDDLRLF